MDLSNIDTILFDLGGVLIDWNPRYVFRQIYDTEEEVEHFLAHICTPEWNEQQDAGRSLAEATTSLILQYPAYADPIRAYYSRWSEMLGGPIEGTVALLDQLKREERYQLYALTNWSAETFPIAQERYAFLQWFAGILVSGVEKMKKPQPEIYHLALERFGLVADRTLFVDDSLRNVEGARAVGIPAYHFQGPAALREVLGY
ncbi:MAG: HAD family phosphatase [Bacteroidota bacterium]